MTRIGFVFLLDDKSFRSNYRSLSTSGVCPPASALSALASNWFGHKSPNEPTPAGGPSPTVRTIYIYIYIIDMQFMLSKRLCKVIVNPHRSWIRMISHPFLPRPRRHFIYPQPWRSTRQSLEPELQGSVSYIWASARPCFRFSKGSFRFIAKQAVAQTICLLRGWTLSAQ
jgi:hypothetical protein